MENKQLVLPEISMICVFSGFIYFLAGLLFLLSPTISGDNKNALVKRIFGVILILLFLSTWGTWANMTEINSFRNVDSFLIVATIVLAVYLFPLILPFRVFYWMMVMYIFIFIIWFTNDSFYSMNSNEKLPRGEFQYWTICIHSFFVHFFVGCSFLFVGLYPLVL